jgi:hypothetical protein
VCAQIIFTVGTKFIEQFQHISAQIFILRLLTNGILRNKSGEAKTKAEDMLCLP